MKYQRSLCWMRRDLRLKDHAALAEATRRSEQVFVVFIFDTLILSKLQDQDDKRITFIAHSLREMDQELRRKGSGLIVRHGNPTVEIPKLAKQLKVETVFANRDYEPYAKKRDEYICRQLEKERTDFFLFKDQVIFEYPKIQTRQKEPFRVFTPYKNAWLVSLDPTHYLELSPRYNKLASLEKIKIHLWSWDLNKLGFQESPLWLDPGEKAARKRLKNFERAIKDYEKTRNYPSLKKGTSGLSVHLRFGTISIRHLVRFALKYNSEDSLTWLSELIWRDFYQTILDRFPHITTGCFRTQFDRILWPGKKEHFKLWQKGMTGYPIVDAAMRNFNKTGWMHNRLRMVVASFLIKDLLIDWRNGEAWFARKLLDFDLASNNGGWQWCASTGCDAQPYFRIFNPVTQSKKFDSEGKFIRENIPELAGFSNRRIHWPHSSGLEEQKTAQCILGKEYPRPVVDHALQREKALALFKTV